MSLATEADAILGMDFLKLFKAKIDLEGNKMWLLKKRKVNHVSSERRVRGKQGVANRAALTIFTAPNSRDKRKSCPTTQRKGQEVTRHENDDSSSATETEAQPRRVETTRIPPGQSGR